MRFLLVALSLAATARAQTPVLLRDVEPRQDPISGAPASFLRLGADALFFAVNAKGGEALWKSDGTAGGTIRLGLVGKAYPLGAEVAGAKLFFIIDGLDGTRQLWTSNGTPAGTAMVMPPFDRHHRCRRAGPPGRLRRL